MSSYDHDEPTEPFTPEPDQPRKPVGYSRDQLRVLSPAAAFPESIAEFQQPSRAAPRFEQPTMVRTNQVGVLSVFLKSSVCSFCSSTAFSGL